MIGENLKIINDRIKEAEVKSGRTPGSVKLMAVSKFHPVECVLEAINNGQFLFGENRVQEAFEKFPPVIQKNSRVELHMIGSLQSNKVLNACKVASCIQSVDRISLIKEIEKQCTKLNKTMKILFELHTGEDSKSGFESFESLREALVYCNDGNTPHIEPCGFMTMAPFTDDKDKIRYSFSTLRETAEKLKADFPSFNLSELSMGMSGDFETAIEEGSTLIRVGTAIFGERQY